MSAESQRLIGALLGAAEREISCEECFEELDRYVESELAGEDADRVVPGMRPHLEGCPACSEDHASLLDFVKGDRPAHTAA